MESLLGAMSGIIILFGFGYLILSIFIIVYFFRMSDDVRKLKETLEEIRKIMIKKNIVDMVKSDTTDKKKLTEFKIGDLVVNIKTGKQMRVNTINLDEGTYSCYTNGGTTREGDFDESEIKLFNS